MNKRKISSFDKSMVNYIAILFLMQLKKVHYKWQNKYTRERLQ